MKLQRFGGYASIAGVCGFIAYIVFYSLLQRRIGDASDMVKQMTAISAATVNVCLLNTLWMACYILLLIAFFALHDRMQANAPRLTRIMLIAASAGAVMGITESIVWTIGGSIVIPMKDVSAYRAYLAVAEGLHFVGGHTFAWTCLFAGCAVLSTRAYSRGLGWILLVTGIVWIPNFFFVGIGFALVTPIVDLLCCVCGIWIGIALLRQKLPQPAHLDMAVPK